MGAGRTAKGLLALCLAAIFLTSCKDDAATVASVVVYVSVDQNYAEPILNRFAEETGLAVRPVFDVEAAKTSGLTRRLAAEVGNPQADVFWSGEPVQTEVLAQQSVFSAYVPEDLRPGAVPGPGGYWTAFGGRARVLIINRDRLAPEDWPRSVFDLVSDARDTARAAMAYPLFGTTATHASALYTTLGPAPAQALFDEIVARDVRIVDGNSVVRDLVVAGTADFGLTDTDDACGAVQRNPGLVAVVLPDQGESAMGTLVIPNTVALVSGGPNPDAGRKLIDYLLSETVAQALADAGWFHVDGTRVFSAADCGIPDRVTPMEVDYAALARTMGDVMRDLRDRVLR